MCDIVCHENNWITWIGLFRD